MKAFPLLALSAFLFLVPAASANTIPETAIFEAERIDDTGVGVGDEEGLVVLRIETPGLPKLAAWSRSASGILGSQMPLSYTSNAEMPRNISIDPSGNTFLSWGVATSGANGEYASRPANGNFSAASTYVSPACQRFQSVSAKPSGGFLIACSATQGSAPLDDTLLLSGIPNYSSSAFEPEVQAQAATDDNFIQPLTDVAPDGTMAVAWGTTRENPPGTFLSRIRAVVSDDGNWAGSATTNLSFISSATAYVSGARMVALQGGQAAVLWVEGNTADPSYGRLYLRLVGPLGAVGSPIPVSVKPTSGYSLVRSGDELLLAWAESDGGMGDPITTKVASYNPDTGLSPSTTLESGAPFYPGQLQGNSRGDIILPRGNGESLSAWVRPAGSSSFSAPQTIVNYAGTLTPDQWLQDTSIALDEEGNVFASWVLADNAGSNADKAYWGGLDFTGPRIESFLAPVFLLADEEGAFSVVATDTSGTEEVLWDFGDGQTATGSSVSHAYNDPGTYTVRVQATDRAGRSSEQTAEVRVAYPEQSLQVSKTSAKVVRKNIMVISKGMASSSGKVQQIVRRGKKTLCKTKKTTEGRFTLSCSLGSQARKTLRNKNLLLRVQVRFEPNKGESIVRSKKLIVRKRR